MDLKGKETTFYDYEKTSGRINIPSSIAKSLGWKHKDKLFMTVEKINGHKGLFIFQKED